MLTTVAITLLKGYRTVKVTTATKA